MLLNWVRFRPIISDGGATSSTESWSCDRRPTQGCLGLAPIRWSKQCGIDILPMFLLRLGSNLQMHMASFASHVIWKGSLLITLKLETNGKGWWKSVLSIPYVKAEPQRGHCTSMLTAQMSMLTAHPHSLNISPSFCTFLHTSTWHSTDYNKGWTDSMQQHTHLIYLYQDMMARGGGSQYSVWVWLRWRTYNVPWPSPQGPRMFPIHMKTCTHLLGIPSSRQYPSFSWWGSCHWGALAWIWRCWFLWNKPV